MTDPIEIMALAMQESRAWPAVHGAGTADVLSRVAVSALTEAGYAIVPKDRLDDANIMLAIHGMETVPVVGEVKR
ncbi:MAG TPA: hypothetical protein PKD48_01840 [Sphingopyxis sp.]|nr:hypothetical protein [Sphingopyxis sp.]